MAEKKSEGTTTTFFHFLKAVSHYRWLFLAALITTGLVAVGNVVISHLMRQGVDGLFSGQPDQFRGFAGRFLVVILSITVLTFLERFLIGRFAELSITKIRRDVVSKMNSLPLSYLDNQHSGDLVSRVTNDLNQLREFTSENLLPLFYMPLVALLAIGYMLTINWILTLLVLILAPLLGTVVSLVSSPMNEVSKELQESLGDVNSRAQDALQGLAVVKAFNLEDIHNQKYEENVDQSVISGLELAMRRSILIAVSIVASFTPFFIGFGFGGYMAAHGIITLGAFIAFINLTNYLSTPLNAIPHLIGQAHVGMAAYRRIEEVMEMAEERSDGTDFPVENSTGPLIEFTDVDFSYADDAVLKDLSFAVNPGETLALVGPSGSGKSTILKLVAGFYSPTSGQLRLFDHQVESWSLLALRKHISLVTQETYLYPKSIGENIADGCEPASQHQIRQAAKLANADQFIAELPQGYHTLVGERGNKLSGGQKQRIALARAILKDAEVLLLDEPTSALDIESESLVQAALNRFMAGKTTVVVAHRLSTIKQADRILVIDQGRVVEEGTHQELLAHQGTYYELYKTQFEVEGKEGGAA